MCLHQTNRKGVRKNYGTHEQHTKSDCRHNLNRNCNRDNPYDLASPSSCSIFHHLVNTALMGDVVRADDR